jgi:hypothetical protein
MKTSPSLTILAALCVTIIVPASSADINVHNTLAEPSQAIGQIFVTGFDGSLESPGFIREYTTSGALVNPALISGLTRPEAIAVSDGNLFVLDKDSIFTSHIGLYTTSGTTVNPQLITGLGQVIDIAVSGNFLYVSGLLPNFRGAVSKYTTSGRLANRFLITGGEPAGIAVSGDRLFVTFPGFTESRVGEYTTSGQVVNRNLITNISDGNIALSGENLFLTPILGGPVSEYTTSGVPVNLGLIATFQAGDIAASGDKLFVNNLSDNTISEYTTSGNLVKRNLISPGGDIAIVPGSEQSVPEAASSWILLLLALWSIWAFRILLLFATPIRH